MPSMTPHTPEERAQPAPKGPHPSYIETAKPYIFEHQVQTMLQRIGISEGVEENSRVMGVSWIDNVRRALLLPVRTYNTACIYLHKFRLTHRDDQYDYRSAAAAALFCACKIEDTPKKSRDILAAAYNLHRNTADHVPADSTIFDDSSKTIHALERLMLESSGFDFRNRYPQKLLVKLAKHQLHASREVGTTAFRASLDLYRTYAPLKQTTQVLALASIELAARLHDAQDVLSRLTALDLERWSATRAEVLETLLDLLEMYAHSGRTSQLGASTHIDTLIPITIELRRERSAKDLPRYTMAPPPGGTPLTSPTDGDPRASIASAPSSGSVAAGPGANAFTPSSVSPQSPAQMVSGGTAAERGREGTVRFMLDPERAIEEKRTVREFFVMHEVAEYV